MKNQLYILVGIIFVTTMGVLLYHFHATHVAKYKIFTWIKSKMPSKLQNVTETNPRTTNWNYKASHDQPRNISKTVISLREPLLESSGYNAFD